MMHEYELNRHPAAKVEYYIKDFAAWFTMESIRAALEIPQEADLQGLGLELDHSRAGVECVKVTSLPALLPFSEMDAQEAASMVSFLTVLPSVSRIHQQDQGMSAYMQDQMNRIAWLEEQVYMLLNEKIVNQPKPTI